jgi:hypothetical protein
MLGIGLGILFGLPIVSSTFFDDETTVEKTINDLITSTLPTLSVVLLLLGSIGLGVHSLLKNKLDLRPRQR